MKKIKFSALESEKNAVEINRAYFQRRTKAKWPYVQIGADGEEHAYAVCPICNNPAVLVGFFHEIKGQKKGIYGRHIRHDVEGIADFKESAYKKCPYHREGGPYLLEISGLPETEEQKEIRETAESEWSEVIDSIQANTGLYLSRQLRDQIKAHYEGIKGWKAYDAHIYNIPAVAFYLEEGISVYGRKVLRGSPLYTLLRSANRFIFDESDEETVQITGHIENKGLGKFVNEELKAVKYRFQVKDKSICDFMTVDLLEPDSADVLSEVTFVWNYDSFMDAVQT